MLTKKKILNTSPVCKQTLYVRVTNCALSDPFEVRRDVLQEEAQPVHNAPALQTQYKSVSTVD